MDWEWYYAIPAALVVTGVCLWLIGRGRDVVTAFRKEEPPTSIWEELKNELHGSPRERARGRLRTIGVVVRNGVLIVAACAGVVWQLHGFTLLVRWLWKLVFGQAPGPWVTLLAVGTCIYLLILLAKRLWERGSPE